MTIFHLFMAHWLFKPKWSWHWLCTTCGYYSTIFSLTTKQTIWVPRFSHWHGICIMSLVFWGTFFAKFGIATVGFHQRRGSPNYIKGCFTIRVHFQKLHSSPVLTVEAYFDFKVLLPKHWSGLGLPTAIKRRLESIKKICSFVMILPKIAVPFGFSQILCSSITWNKHKESLFVNSEEIIWTRPF